MKEYKSKAGGRPLYNEDIQNLQELSLSMTEFLKGSGLSFVLSGCEITSRSTDDGLVARSVSSGYVFLNGKIRKVEARDIGTVPPPVYICERNTSTGNGITYADRTSDEQFIDYEGEVRTSQETLSGQYLTSEDGNAFPDVKTAFFNHYSLVKDTGVEQYVRSFTTFGNGIKTAIVKLLKSNVSADVTIDQDGNFTVILGTYLEHQYSLVFYRESGELGVNDNGKPVWRMSVNADGTITMPPMSLGDIIVNGNVDAADIVANTVRAVTVTADSLVCTDRTNELMYLRSGMEEIDGNGEGKWLAPFLKFIAKSGTVTSETLVHIFRNTVRIGTPSMSVDFRLDNERRELNVSRTVHAPNLVSDGDIYENGQKLSDVYLKKATNTSGDSGWVNLINARTGEPIPGLMARNKYDILLQIRGTIPKDILQYPYGGSSYMAKLPIRIPEELSFGDTEEAPIGNSYYATFGGGGMNIPVKSTVNVLFTFVATLSPIGIGGHSPEVNVDCVLGVKSDRCLYLLGARFPDGCTWNGHNDDSCAPYALDDVALNIRTLMI